MRRRAEKWTIQTEGGADSLPSCPGIHRTGKMRAKTESTLLHLSLARLSGAQRRDGSPPHSLAPRSPHPSAGLLVRSGAGRGGQPPRAAAILSFRLLPLLGLCLQLGEGRGLEKVGRVLGGAWAGARGGGAEGGAGGRGSCSVGLAAVEGLGAARRLGAAGADAGSESDAWRWRLWRYARERARACWPPFWDGAPRPPLCPLLV